MRASNDALSVAVLAFFALAASALFLDSVWSGGVSIDERADFLVLGEQIRFADNLLFDNRLFGLDGPPFTNGFHSIANDYEYYGIGTYLPAGVVYYLTSVLWLGLEPKYSESFSFALHILAFISALAATWYTGNLVYVASHDREVSILAALALLVTPTWLGYSFIDYKDVPIAAGLIATVYYSAAIIKNPTSRSSVFFFAALLFLGSQKIAALALALPACMAVAWVVVQHRSMRLLVNFAGLATGFLILLYIITPPSWQEPVEFVVSSVTYMSQHAWRGCTLTSGECIGPFFNAGVGYSAAKYLGLWYAVKLPLLLQIGLVAATIFYLVHVHEVPPVVHLIVASLFWPIVAMILRNATLYDGIRHTLFVMPLAVSFVFVSLPEGLFKKWRLAVVLYAAFLLIDMARLQPYGHIWFNEWARFSVSERNYAMTHWGYPTREAINLSLVLQKPNEWIVGGPGHLAELFVKNRFAYTVEMVPKGNNYLLVQLGIWDEKAFPGCRRVGEVTRRQVFAPRPLRLAFVARCKRES